jgi:hypothetical protein
MAKRRKAANAHSPAGRRRTAGSKLLERRKSRGQSSHRKAQVECSGSRPKSLAASAEPRSSKQAEVIALLRRPEGAVIAEVVAATGWQPHTVRGFFSGTLKKKLGLLLASQREERGRAYRMVEGGVRSAGAARKRSR